MKRLRQGLLALVVLLGLPAVVLYADGADYSVGISQKLGHGLLNVLSSPLELPCAIRDDVSERGGAGIVTGLFKGITFFARRVLVGVTEVGTFMMPMEETLPAVQALPPL